MNCVLVDETVPTGNSWRAPLVALSGSEISRHMLTD